MLRICRFCLLLFMCVIMAACGSTTRSNGTPTSGQASATKEPEMQTAQRRATITPTTKNNPDPKKKLATATPVPPDPTPTTSPEGQQQDPTPPPDPTQAPDNAPVGSSGSGLYGAPPAISADESGVTQQLFNQINKDRSADGKPAYTWNETLAGGARLHSWNMAHCGLSHACSGEPDPCQREINEGIQYMACGENVGYSSPNPDTLGGALQIEKSMLAEQPPNDGHRRNLLSNDFHQVGVGIYVDSQGLVWVTQDFSN